jgi:urease accessory protein
MGNFHNLSPAPLNLELTYALTERGTQIIRQKTLSPFLVQRPFYPEGEDVCHTLLIHNGGGIVGGDRLLSEIQLLPQAQALITTATATKVYRSLEEPSQQTTRIDIKDSAYLEWFPQALIIFNGANYRQHLRVELGDGAIWCGGEIIRFGRTGRGERFESGYWQSTTEVYQNKIPLWIDRQELRGGKTAIESWQGLAGCPIVASLAWIGQEVETEMVQKARQLGENHTQQGMIGVTRLQSGLLCRYRGHSRSSAQAWLIAVWNLLRLTYRHRLASLPSVWQLQPHYGVMTQTLE